MIFFFKGRIIFCSTKKKEKNSLLKGKKEFFSKEKKTLEREEKKHFGLNKRKRKRERKKKIKVWETKFLFGKKIFFF